MSRPIRVVLVGTASDHEARDRAVSIAESQGCRAVEFEQVRRFRGGDGAERISVYLRGDVPRVSRSLRRSLPGLNVLGPYPVREP